MDDEEIEHIKMIILRRLIRHNIWGGKHTPYIREGLPKESVGSKKADQAIKTLISDTWVIAAKKTGETHYSLNPRKAAEIKQFYLKRS